MIERLVQLERPELPLFPREGSGFNGASFGRDFAESWVARPPKLDD